MMSLLHQEVLVNTYISSTNALAVSSMQDTCNDIEATTISITDCLRETVQLGLVRYFPISM